MSEIKINTDTKFVFYLYDGTILYSCKTEEKKNKYELSLIIKNIKYKLVTL